MRTRVVIQDWDPDLDEDYDKEIHSFAELTQSKLDDMENANYHSMMGAIDPVLTFFELFDVLPDSELKDAAWNALAAFGGNEF